MFAFGYRAQSHSHILLQESAPQKKNYLESVQNHILPKIYQRIFKNATENGKIS